MIIFGGGCGRHECRDAAAFNPRTHEWRRIATPPVPGYAHSTVWTGKEMIVWGGTDQYEDEGHFGFPGSFLNTGAAYDPSRDRWRLLADAPLDPRGWHTAVWTGREMLVWGGVEEPRSDCYDCGYPSDAGAYDPRADTWREIDPGGLSGRVEHSAVWTGRWMIVYGGSAPGGGQPGGKDDGAVYDPGSDSWSRLPEAPIRGRYRHAALWNGHAMIVWAGQRPNGGPFFDGALFYPGH
jgi:N-acetylneuraminic acid mutarotase